MKPIVTINGKRYTASKRRVRNDVYHAVFRPVDKPKKADEIVIHEAIHVRNGLIGGQNAMGPCGSPAREGKVYHIQGYSVVEYIDQRAWDYLARLAEQRNDD